MQAAKERSQDNNLDYSLAVIELVKERAGEGELVEVSYDFTLRALDFDISLNITVCGVMVCMESSLN